MSLSFDPEALRLLAELINSTGLSEIELAEGDRKLRLARTITPIDVPVGGQAYAPAPAALAPASAPAAPAAEPKFDPAKHPGTVKSPMVGVAYLSAEPGAAPYVAVGQSVEAGATLLLIEAMKTFNQIKAPKAGTVTRILVSAGAPVEYDEPLLIIE
jgi:acetyl-CoA carboxylase biotin carboxyl carrier protein